MIFTEKLAKLCEMKGWNQTVLARVAGVSKNTSGRWLSGAVKPFDDSALKLARAFGVPLDYLADDEMDEPAGTGGLSREDEAVLRVFHALRLSGDEALRRLSGLPPDPAELPTRAPARDHQRGA